MGEGDGATELFRVRKNFAVTLVEVRAFSVPVSERYPEGVKYSMQYARTDDEETAWPDKTIVRYDNFPDHPGAPHHHKHTEDGRTIGVDFEGVRPLYRRFKREVREHGEHWD